MKLFIYLQIANYNQQKRQAANHTLLVAHFHLPASELREVTEFTTAFKVNNSRGEAVLEYSYIHIDISIHLQNRLL